MKGSDLVRAFEVTESDVALVCANYGIFDQATIDRACDIVFSQAERVAKAALHGDDLDTQTRYAHEEITTILSEAGLLGR